MKSIVDLISYIGKQKNGVENDGIDFMTLKISSMKLLQNSYNAKRNIVQSFCSTRRYIVQNFCTS